jgi:hypothetical protein
VTFTTATYGINTAGTVYRMDDVPIFLRPAFPSRHPSDFDVLSAIPAAGDGAEAAVGPESSPAHEQRVPQIAGGTVYDPVHGVNGERRDIWIRDGKIVAPPSEPDARPDRTSTPTAWS